MSIQDAIDGVCEKEPLFTNMVTRLKLVKDNEGCPTLGTDGENLYYNQDYLDTLSEPEACGVVLHEVLHCAFQHQWRRDDRDQWAWNIATDYAINTVVNESFPLPEGCLLDMKYYGMSAEDIYDSLPKDKKKKSKDGEGEGESGKGKGQGQQGWCDKSSWPNGKGKGKGNGKGEPSDEDGDGDGDVMDIFRKMFGNTPKFPSTKKKGKSQKQIQEEWKDLFDETFLKNYGKLPGSLQRIISKKYYIPVVDWSTLVQNLLSEDDTDYTFAQPDRRFLSDDFMIPGMQSWDKLKDVVFAYDTSGSISQDDLNSYYMETLNLFSNFSSLQGWIAVCDAYLHHFGEVNPQMGFDDFKFYGGGGTAFEPVFEKIKEMNIKPKALFYFSDTEGSFPDEAPEYPVFWLVRSHVGDRHMPTVPFGQVIKFLG